ncbi:MAG: hypothetical protein M3Z27_09585 [Actinomycetota bacterium]|nr:hypothetical protein [Actinomycetota bacterium]
MSSQSADISPSRPAPGGSERVRLARLARQAALRVTGVAGTDSGPAGLFLTAGGGERLEGVRCVVTQDGGYEVTLRLVCELVSLPELGARVRAAVTDAAARAGIPLESIGVHVAALAEAGEQ